MSREIAVLSFTDRGEALAEKLCRQLGGTAAQARRIPQFSLAQWTRDSFSQKDAIVFVGAVGIAVRAIAPFIRSKAEDPAVVAVDECGRYAVAVLSGHLGGANDLAREIAGICGGEAVITTATDRRGVFAVDEWARRQNCAVVNPEAIRRVSGAILAGRRVRVHSEWEIQGDPPEGVELTQAGDCEIWVSLNPPPEDALWLTPRIAVLGVGCRRGVPAERLERAFQGLMERSGICPQSIVGAATIELKKEEPGLQQFCRQHGWPLCVYSAEELREAQGSFSPSEFVSRITGVDNVCERSAVLASGGSLRCPKTAGDGVALALAVRPLVLDWRWQNGKGLCCGTGARRGKIHDI